MTEGPPVVAPDGSGRTPGSEPSTTVPGPQVAAGPTASDPASDSPVAAAGGLLAQLSERPLHEHPDVYDQVHGELRRVLADIDDA